MKRLAAGCLAAAVIVGGCGKSEEQKQAEQQAQQAAKAAQEQAKTAEQGAQQAAKGLEQLAKGLEGMMAGGATGDLKPVDPVSFRDLQALFPDLDGWEKGKPEGERMTQPVSFSQAEVRYKKGESSISLKIIDSGFNRLLLAPFAMFLTAGYEKETSSGYEKSTMVNAQPGWEKWQSERKNGEVNALVNKRFLVNIEGREVDDIKVLHDVAGKIDMAKLAAMK
jgi:hypothetical protein